jgi:hypothetical protein
MKATCHLRQQERIQLKNGEWGEVAWGGPSIPHDVAHVETRGEAVGKTGIQKAKLKNLVLELPVGHSRGVPVDDAKVGLRDFLGEGELLLMDAALSMRHWLV